MRIRALAIAAAAAAAVLAPAVDAVAAAGGTGHTVTETDHLHQTFVESGDTDFCTGAEVTPTFDGNEVFHATWFPGGDEAWGTFTEEGSVSFDLGALTYTGRVTVWGNFNVNERNGNDTFTASVDLTATDTDGVVHSEVGHEVMHIGWNAVSDQPVVSFDRMDITCS